MLCYLLIYYAIQLTPRWGFHAVADYIKYYAYF